MLKFNILTPNDTSLRDSASFEPLSAKIGLISRSDSEKESVNTVSYLVTWCCKSFATNSTFKRFLSWM